MFKLKFKEKVLILGATIAVLAVTCALGILFSAASVQRREASTPVFPQLNKAQIGLIELSDKTGRVKLKKEGAGWSVQIGDLFLPASGSRVDGLLAQLASLKRSRIVTNNPEKWKDFQVSEDTAKRVKLADAAGKAAADLLVGKESLSGRENYLRLQGANEVLQSDRSLGTYLNLESKFWSQLKPFPSDLNSQDLNRISLKGRLKLKEETRELNYTLALGGQKEKNAWKLEGDPGAELANDKVDGLASSLVLFEGSEYAVGVKEEAAGLSPAQAEVFFSTVKDKSFRLLVGAALPGGEQYYVKLEGAPFIYLASEWRVKQVLPALAELKAKKEAAKSPQGTKSP